MSDVPYIREIHGESATPTVPHLAVQERLLSGATERERIQQAEYLGVVGVEFNAEGLGDRVDDICDALENSPIKPATVRLGMNYNFISQDKPTRQQALDALRYAMTDAVDIGASGVVMVPHTGTELGLPDLMPLKAPVQLAVELMVLHLRTLSDLAYVFGLTLYLHPVNRYESAFLNRLDQGEELLRRIKFNSHVKLAADTYHMGLSEDNPIHALEDTAASMGHIYLADNTGDLPGQGFIDFADVRRTCTARWAVITHYLDETPSLRQVRRVVSDLRDVGF